MCRVIPDRNKKQKRVEPTLVEPESDEIDDLESGSYSDDERGRVVVPRKRAKPLSQRMPPYHRPRCGSTPSGTLTLRVLACASTLARTTRATWSVSAGIATTTWRGACWPFSRF